MVFMWSFYPLRGFILSACSSIRVPKSHLLFCYGCLPLSESTAGRNLSEESHAGLPSASLTVSLIVSGIGVSPWGTLSWPGYWLAILSVSFPSPIPVFLVDKINLGSKVLWVGWCLYCSMKAPLPVARQIVFLVCSRMICHVYASSILACVLTESIYVEGY